MDKLRQLQQRFNELVSQLRAAQGEENPDASKVANIETEIRSLAGQIETERAIIRTQDGVDPERRYSETPVGNETSGETPEVRDAVLAYMRTGDRAQLRNMTSGKTGGSDTGGYLIPHEWESQILEKQREMFVMRSLADVQSSDLDKVIPVADDHGESGWISEGAAYPESGAEFSQKELHAYKVGRICKVSEELLMDNTYNLEQWLINAFSYTNGLAMEKAYISGDGVGKPSGFLHDADPVAAAGAVLSYDDFLALFADLKQGYHTNAKWLMNIGSLTAIMKLKDDAGNYLYSPFIPKTPTEPLGQILGKPVVISSLMPGIGTGNKPVAFGDFKRYRIQDRAGFAIMRMNELYAENGFIGFRGMQRTDGKLLMFEAIKALEF